MFKEEDLKDIKKAFNVPDDEWPARKAKLLAMYESAEEFWLRFVMWQQSGKVWNGTEWVDKKLDS